MSIDINIKDKTILVTGATNGIGKVLATAGVKHGTQMILLDKSIPALEQLYDELYDNNHLSEHFHDPILLPVDLSGATLDDYLKVADDLSANISQLDGIIHNAAHFDGLYALMQTPPESLLKVLQTNFISTIWLNQALFPLLEKSERPCLLFADHEEATVDDAAYWGVYALTKLALMKSMQLLALENERFNLHCYGYNSGWVDTKLIREAYPNAMPDWDSPTPALADAIYSLFNCNHKNGSVVKLDYQPTFFAAQTKK